MKAISGKANRFLVSGYKSVGTSIPFFQHKYKEAPTLKRRY
jgi:hypothetical protein